MKEFVMGAVEEVIAYLRNRYQINVSTENFIRNKIQAALMRNPEKERLEAKLKLWETPGFSQFLKDLEEFLEINSVVQAAESQRKLYQEELRLLKEADSKFTQTKLDL